MGITDWNRGSSAMGKGTEGTKNSTGWTGKLEDFTHSFTDDKWWL